jgi:hypothetical protein
MNLTHRADHQQLRWACVRGDSKAAQRVLGRWSLLCCWGNKEHDAGGAEQQVRAADGFWPRGGLQHRPLNAASGRCAFPRTVTAPFLFAHLLAGAALRQHPAAGQ